MPLGWNPAQTAPITPQQNRYPSNHGYATGSPGFASPAGPAFGQPLASPPYYNQQPINPPPRGLPRGRGSRIRGSWTAPGTGTDHYEAVDSSFFVRPKSFFAEGRVLAMVVTEAAGENRRPTDYNSAWSNDRNISTVKYTDHKVFTQTRRFVVVRQRREFAFACPIFTYNGRATTKPGVKAEEHGIAFSWGREPQTLSGESGITKAPIGVVMTDENSPLDIASRIYFGIHHPIQYNVKVKDIGFVHQEHMHILIGNWKEEDRKPEDSDRPRFDAESDDDDDDDDDDTSDKEVVAKDRKGKKPQTSKSKTKTSKSPSTAPDLYLYDAEKNPYGYDTNFNPHVYHPTHNSYGYHPDYNKFGYHPSSSPHMYHPQYNTYGYHPKEKPKYYHPVENPHTYHPTSNPHGYSAKHNENGYHPKRNEFGYHPETHPDMFHPTHNPRGYHPETSPHSYHPEQNPYGYHYETAPYCYHPHFSPYGYHSTASPSGFHPHTMPYNYHPQGNPHGYHAKINPTAYHPSQNPSGYQTQYNNQRQSQGHSTAGHELLGEDSDGDEEEDEDEEDNGQDNSDLYEAA